jgi:hypothetical protein
MPVVTRLQKQKATKEHEECSRNTNVKQCGVCYEPVFPGFVFKEMPTGSEEYRLPLNGIACVNGHATCAECARKIVFPIRWCGSYACTSFGFKCPVCRNMACVHKVELFTLLRGENTAIKDVFPSSQQLNWWLQGTSPPPP